MKKVTRTNKVINMGNWEEYSVHDENNVKGFFGPYRWLSNFCSAEVFYDGRMYPSTETAYQSAKLTWDCREPFTDMDDDVSKHYWYEEYGVEVRVPNWDDRKRCVMEQVVRDKFMRNEEFGEKLLATGNKHLEEINHWGDHYWGTCHETGKGLNNLGLVLMETRRILQTLKNS